MISVLLKISVYSETLFFKLLYNISTLVVLYVFTHIPVDEYLICF